MKTPRYQSYGAHGSIHDSIAQERKFAEELSKHALGDVDSEEEKKVPSFLRKTAADMGGYLDLSNLNLYVNGFSSFN